MELPRDLENIVNAYKEPPATLLWTVGYPANYVYIHEGDDVHVSQRVELYCFDCVAAEFSICEHMLYSPSFNDNHITIKRYDAITGEKIIHSTIETTDRQYKLYATLDKLVLITTNESGSTLYIHENNEWTRGDLIPYYIFPNSFFVLNKNTLYVVMNTVYRDGKYHFIQYDLITKEITTLNGQGWIQAATILNSELYILVPQYRDYEIRKLHNTTFHTITKYDFRGRQVNNMRGFDDALYLWDRYKCSIIHMYSCITGEWSELCYDLKSAMFDISPYYK